MDTHIANIASSAFSERNRRQDKSRMDALHNSTYSEKDLQRRAQAARRLHAQSGGYAATRWSMMDRLQNIFGQEK